MELVGCLKQLEAKHMNLAELLIRRGVITEVTSEHGDSRFHHTVRQLPRFQEEVEGITDALQEAQAEQRSAQECKLKSRYSRQTYSVRQEGAQAQKNQRQIIPGLTGTPTRRIEVTGR